MIIKPLWSRCSLGRNRWYWVVYRKWDDVFNDADAVTIGHAASAAECEVAVLAIEPTATCYRTFLASGHHRESCVQRRIQKPASDSKQAVQQQFLYTDHDRGDYWNGTGDWLYSCPDRVIKVTKHSTVTIWKKMAKSGHAKQGSGSSPGPSRKGGNNTVNSIWWTWICR